MARAYRDQLKIERQLYGFQNGTAFSKPGYVTVLAADGFLGNFMFAYASLVGVARINGRVPAATYNDKRFKHFESMDLEYILKPVFFSTANDSEFQKRRLREKNSMTFTPSFSALNLASMGPLAIEGYLQSWKYFEGFEKEIRAMLTFKEEILSKAMDTIVQGFDQLRRTAGSGDLNDTNIRLVGIHVRRGDILKDDNRKHGHVPASEEYLLDVTALLTKLYTKFSLFFFVLSNDIPYCKTVFVNESNFVFVTGNSDAVDMAVITLMDIVVLTVGTYGWWGAFLSDATDVTYYKDWPKAGSAMRAKFVREDYFPPNWRGL